VLSLFDEVRRRPARLVRLGPPLFLLGLGLAGSRAAWPAAARSAAIAGGAAACALLPVPHRRRKAFTVAALALAPRLALSARRRSAPSLPALFGVVAGRSVAV
jgi:hypothetical protein